MTVKIVTDSVSDLPKEVIRDLNISIVPLTVRFGTEEFRDGVDLDADEFYERLTNGPELPQTAVPPMGEYAELYERLAESAEGIVSIHISSKVSGTFNSAAQGAEQAKAGCPIEVVDSLQASMAYGLAVVASARAAKEGASFAEVVKIANSAVGRSGCTALLDTLEYLEKGGRIGKAQALVGSLLRIKPMIQVRDGVVHPFDRPRTRAKGIARLEQVAREAAPLELLAVVHSTTPDEAHELADRLSDLVPEGEKPLVARYGPALGTYVGPRALGVGLLRA